MAISTKTAADIVHGSDKELHSKVKGAIIQLARALRDDPANEGTLRQKWALGVMGGGDGHYGAILRELSVRAAIQDGYVADDHAENVVRGNVLAVLDDVIAAKATL